MHSVFTFEMKSPLNSIAPDRSGKTGVEVSTYPYSKSETDALLEGYGSRGSIQATSVITMPDSVTISPDVAEFAAQIWSPGVPDYDEGIGVFATPKAEFDGELINPISDLPTSLLVTDPEIQSVMPNPAFEIPPIGESDGIDDREWLREPERVHNTETTIVGVDGVLETYAGVIGTRDDSIDVFVHMTRVETDDDIIIVSAVQRVRSDGIPVPSFEISAENVSQLIGEFAYGEF